MSEIVVEYGRFLEVQQRRARIAAELDRAHDTPPPAMPLAAVSTSTEVSEGWVPAIDVKASVRGIGLARPDLTR